MSMDRDFDHLIAGGPTGPEHRRLAELLAAAAGPARADELTGEEGAVVAFRQARLAGTPAPRRPSMIKLALAKLLTVKAAAAAAAVTVAGGAALAATGNMPGPLAELGSGQLRPAPAESGAERTEDAGAGGIGPAAVSASPSPSLEGLCQAFLAQVGEEPGHALDSPAFRVLVRAAGGEDDVEELCVELVSERPGEVPPVQPGQPPVPLPTVVPTHPGGGPPGDTVPGPPDQ